MNKFVATVGALCLTLLAPQAIAQHDRHDHGHHDHHGDWHHGDSHDGDRHHGDRRHGDWHHGSRWGHGHHDWSRYRHSGWSHRRFHHGAFHWPHGYHYRRWSYGEFLPNIFFATNYWLNDWRVYGLYAPPPGLVWVRHGPDALLVDRYTGEIVRVRYNVFY